jgi:hypothetical protein
MRIFFRRNLYTKSKHILCSVTFLSENLAVYEKMWKNIVERGRPQMTIRRMRIACWVPKATNTLSEYVTLISSRCNNCFTNAPHCYFIRAILVLLCVSVINKRAEDLQYNTFRPVYVTFMFILQG